MQTGKWAAPTDSDLFAPVGRFEDHTDFPLRPPSTGVKHDYIIAREPYDGEPSLGDNLESYDNEDFAENPPDWYERELPDWLEAVSEN